MSKEEAPKERVIDVRVLLARVTELRELISIVQQQVNELSMQLSELLLSRNTLQELSKRSEGTQALVTIDRLGTAFIPAAIPSNWGSEVVVNIGRNYYVKADRELAIKIIDEKARGLENVINARRRELLQLLNEYNYLQQLLQAILRQARAEASQTT